MRSCKDVQDMAWAEHGLKDRRDGKVLWAEW